MDVRIGVPYARCEKGSFTELVIHARKEEGVSAATLRVGGVNSVLANTPPIGGKLQGISETLLYVSGR